ncbi:MAG: aminodeoxychorismate synthase component I [Oceanospirillaceae bacterium]|nr:aminodeoxychorismate synthase component I [Oceanospirillaceae bacterium]
MLKRSPLSYQTTCSQYLQRVRHLGQAVLLDSGYPHCKRGRFDIISAAPIATLTCTRGRLHGENLAFSTTGITDPFIALQKLQQQAKLSLSNFDTNHSSFEDVPFCGGLLGYFGYDLGRCIEQLPSLAMDDMSLPEMHLGLYNWAIIIDHRLAKCYLVGTDLISATDFAHLERLLGTADKSPLAPFTLTSPFSSNLSAEQYATALTKIDDYILSGDCYQVNFAQRFKASFKGDPLSAYLKLRDAAPTHFSAFIDTAQGAILSLSPERFLSVDRDKKVITQPIKGTQPRSADPKIDAINKTYLENSEKDRSENLMIVDLMRNDISKSCALHSVKVPELFSVESYQNVHHLVSTVEGVLDDAHNAIDLLRHCFPGGSITGAPKIRAMEIIEELEPHRRSIYCGSIGYISLCGRMDSSITIRTLLVENQQIYCWAGGGIVADSVIAEEYQETFDKVNNLLQTLAES